MVETLKQAAAIFGCFSAIATALTLLIGPIRDRVLGLTAIVSGLKCLLRSDMLRIYYKHSNEYKMRQHERENLEAEYKAYKALGGNGFIEDIFNDMKHWEVVS